MQRDFVPEKDAAIAVMMERQDWRQENTHNTSIVLFWRQTLIIILSVFW
jgi:hypothetical protein